MAKGKTDKPPLATTATTATRGGQKWSFERAVVYARCRLVKSAHMTDEKQWLDPASRGLGMLASDPQKLLNDARLKADAFDALRFGVACKIERDEPLSDAVKAWAARFLRGEIEAPIREPGTNQTTSGKQRVILRIVSELKELGGLKATRNEAAKTEESACDAVAVALCDLQMKPESWKGVRDLWKMRTKIAPDLFEK